MSVSFYFFVSLENGDLFLPTMLLDLHIETKIGVFPHFLPALPKHAAYAPRYCTFVLRFATTSHIILPFLMLAMRQAVDVPRL
ncbi:Hypothetical protein, putative [Bodo saltans]|uniref:Uncharacterized protein n=1 Tax=Bodo saltans TaxID=75058 RepID=A0A0S4J455_BODSA|nr:Hypothetical protein, putative [Bodo saltans]|eukprot:CUG76090.1 Hypothetical protein, putative [Bodo saltans]